MRAEPVTPAPKLGATVHLVSPIDNPEVEISRGEELIGFIRRVRLYDAVVPPIWECTIACLCDNGMVNFRAFQDQACRLPGTWHFDDDCATTAEAFE